MYPRGLCVVTLNAAKALLPCTQEMSSDRGQGQWQKKLPGTDGALDKLGGQDLRVLQRVMFVPRVHQRFDQDLGVCPTLAKLFDLPTSARFTQEGPR